MDEIARLKSLNEYQIMDTLPEKEFDDIAELASAITNTPMSIVSFIDSKRQWYKAKIGMDNTEVPMEETFCQHAMKTPGKIMIIPNATLDDRTKDSPYTTGEAHIRAYVSVPIMAHGGETIGTLCVMDVEPRHFSAEQLRVLNILSDRVIKYLDMRKENLIRKAEAETANRKLQEAVSQLKGAQKISRFGSWECELDTMHITWSAEMYGLFGEVDGVAVDIKTWSKNVHLEDRQALMQAISTVFENQKAGVVEYRVKVNGKWMWHMATADIITDGAGKATRMVGTVLDITLAKEAEEFRIQYVNALEEMLFTVSHKFRKPVANYKTIANALRSKNITVQEVLDCVPFISDSADELDEYIHELNDFLHGKRIKLSGPKQVV